MKSIFIREQKHICGKDYSTAPYMEIDLFEVTPVQHKASRKAKQKLATSIAMQQYNDNCSVRYFTQLAITNFGRNDYTLHLTYNDAHHPAPGDEKRVDLDFTNFMKRAQRYCKANGLKCPKWIEVPEYCDIDETGVITGRHHHHVIIESTVSRDVLEDLWRDKNGDKIGLTTCEKIELDHSSFEALTRYMTKRRRHVRKWRQSRGLDKPKTPTPNDSKWSKKKLSEAAKLYVDDRKFWDNQYIGYTFNGCEVRVTANGTYHIIVKMRNKNEDKKRKGARYGDKATA